MEFVFKYRVEVPVLAPTLCEFVHTISSIFLCTRSTWLIIKYRSYTVLFTMSTIVIRRTASLGVLVGFIRLNGSRLHFVWYSIQRSFVLSTLFRSGLITSFLWHCFLKNTRIMTSGGLLVNGFRPFSEELCLTTCITPKLIWICVYHMGQNVWDLYVAIKSQRLRLCLSLLSGIRSCYEYVFMYKSKLRSFPSFVLKMMVLVPTFVLYHMTYSLC